MPISPLPDEFNSPVVFKPLSADARALHAVTPRRSRAWLALLWCEWFAHSRLSLLILGTWLAAVWFLPFFAHPDWILLLGLIYAMLAGPAYGGGDVLEGCEEFSFALPATRSERYLGRLVVGGGALLVLTALNLLVLGLDLPQALSRLYRDTRLVNARALSDLGMLYGLVLAFPFAVFCGGFTCAAVTRSRALVLTSWFWGGLGALLVLFAGLRYEELVWTQFNGLFTCAVLVGFGLVALCVGHQVYRKKEIGPEARRIQLPARWWLWALLFLFGLTVALGLVLSILQTLPNLGPVTKQ